MKKAIAILILAAMLSGCANTEPGAEVVTTTTTSSSSITMTEREKPSESVTTAESKTTTSRQTTTQIYAATTTTTSATITHTAPTSATERTSRETTQPTESKPVSARYEPVRAITTTTAAPITEQQRETTTAMRTTQNTATTTTRATTTAKPMALSTTTTAQPAVTTTAKITVPKPPIISKATTTVIENGITYVEVPDVTCLATMIENLEETDTPPIYYIQVGQKLKHDGTDYGKAIAVYDWMIKNGWGSCVYHALETYYVCQGIGLECAYAFCTDNGWYGHTYNAVKVEGTWYVLDTQGHTFLDNTCHWCKRMFDGKDQDLPPYDEWIWYPYDQNGEYRYWTVEPAE